jgi:hypothetical protein
MNASAKAASEKQTLMFDPLDVQGVWQWPDAAAHVLVRMRDVCLSGVRMVSDRQPDRILVDDHTSGTPAIWLHEENPKTAWIIVHVAGSSWCQLCYQFGHELGHVLCNSWDAQAKPALPCQWIEEALVEAFSIRGLGLLASSWERDPPFPGDAGYARSIREYRQGVLNTYSKLAAEEGADIDLAGWFQLHRSSLDSHSKGDGSAAIPAFLAELEKDNGRVESLGALNRWPQRGGLPIDEYLSRWETSCEELGASSELPLWMRTSLLGG